ncbi:Hsp90 co-chaperone AHA1 [Spathaspora sp. JA1]|nr:Hsp90 co-chaperone AHA1 [Spathaspora sp. JA1]
MVVNNPNNWHWVDKNCLQWSKDYFTEKLVNLTESDDKYTVTIDQVSSVEGDVDVSQRKGKVISLFDLRIVLHFKGDIEKEPVSGSITIPELAFDSDSDGLQFDISIYNENKDNAEIGGFIKKKVIPQLRDILMKFCPDLIEINSKDIQLSSDKINSTFTKANQEASVGSKPVKVESAKTVTSTPKAPVKSTPAETNSSVPKYNTSTLHLEPTFNTTAEQLYLTLLEDARIGAWTRAYPQIEKFPPSEGSEFKLFGGSVSGKFIKLVNNERIVQLWRLEDWKSGHFAELDIQIVQGSSETKLVVKFTGIPIGEEERVKNNFEERYVRAIKIIFGFGAVL